MQTGALSTMVLAGIALLIPVIGFVMTISHARAGDTRYEQRWRKSHGLMFWVLIPAMSGGLMLLGAMGLGPKIFSMVGLILLSLSATISYMLQKRHEKAMGL